MNPSKHILRSKPRRNHPCPCGSGVKFKKCCWIREMKELNEARTVPPTPLFTQTPATPPRRIRRIPFSFALIAAALAAPTRR